jgi:hypothetical protein
MLCCCHTKRVAVASYGILMLIRSSTKFNVHRSHHTVPRFMQYIPPIIITLMCVQVTHTSSSTKAARRQSTATHKKVKKKKREVSEALPGSSRWQRPYVWDPAALESRNAQPRPAGIMAASFGQLIRAADANTRVCPSERSFESMSRSCHI